MSYGQGCDTGGADSDPTFKKNRIRTRPSRKIGYNLGECFFLENAIPKKQDKIDPPPLLPSKLRLNKANFCTY